MAPSVGPEPVDRPIAARRRPPWRALRVAVVLGAAYIFVYRWVDAIVVPDVIAASDPYDVPETKWRVARDPLPEGAAGLYFVPGVGILPVSHDAQWTDSVDVPGVGRITSLFDDSLNTWEPHADLVDLPLLPAFFRGSSRELDPHAKLDGYASEGRSVELQDPARRWQQTLPNVFGVARPRSLPWGIDHLDATFFGTVAQIHRTLPVRSPERNNERGRSSFRWTCCAPARRRTPG